MTDFHSYYESCQKCQRSARRDIAMNGLNSEEFRLSFLVVEVFRIGKERFRSWIVKSVERFWHKHIGTREEGSEQYDHSLESFHLQQTRSDFFRFRLRIISTLFILSTNVKEILRFKLKISLSSHERERRRRRQRNHSQTRETKCTMKIERKRSSDLLLAFLAHLWFRSTDPKDTHRTELFINIINISENVRIAAYGKK